MTTSFQTSHAKQEPKACTLTAQICSLVSASEVGGVITSHLFWSTEVTHVEVLQTPLVLRQAWDVTAARTLQLPILN